MATLMTRVGCSLNRIQYRPVTVSVQRFSSKDAKEVIKTREVRGREFVDIETHTGQKFEPNDYRLSRFVQGKQKLVNTRFAIDLIAEEPPIAVKGRSAYCDGGGPLGHPRVYINLDQPGNHSCGYCGLRYYQEH